MGTFGPVLLDNLTKSFKIEFRHGDYFLATPSTIDERYQQSVNVKEWQWTNEFVMLGNTLRSVSST